MDIRLIGQKTVLSAYTARPAETAGKGSPAPAASAPSPVGDTLELSRSVQDLYRQTEENLAKELLNPEQSGNEGDALTSGMDVQLRCSKIAARIRAGDKVPLKDQQYLLKNNPDLYNLAMIARRAKEHPKKWDSLVPKENPREKALPLRKRSRPAAAPKRPLLKPAKAHRNPTDCKIKIPGVHWDRRRGFSVF